MTTEANGSTSPVRNLPATPELSPVPRPRRPEADSRAPAPDVSRPARPCRPRPAQALGVADAPSASPQADHWMHTRVKHPDGGERTVTETRADEEEQRQQINRETAMGSRKHRRLPRWQGWIPKFVLCFDFALLLYFFAGITNVDWQSPVSMSLAFAITLAGMVTVLAYGFLSFTGHRMRSYKNHAGTVHLDELDGFTKAAFGTAIDGHHRARGADVPPDPQRGHRRARVPGRGNRPGDPAGRGGGQRGRELPRRPHSRAGWLGRGRPAGQARGCHPPADPQGAPAAEAGRTAGWLERVP